MKASLVFLKSLKATGIRSFGAAMAKQAHEARFRTLWRNRHSEDFQF